MRRKMRLKLIATWCGKETGARIRAPPARRAADPGTLGVPVRKVVIQVVAGRNIAVRWWKPQCAMPFCAARHRHYQEFVMRHRCAMESGESF